MNYIINTQAIVLFLDGKPLRVEKTDTRYPKILKAFKLPTGQQEKAIREALHQTDIVTRLTNSDRFKVMDGTVYYNGEALPKALEQKVKSIIRDDLSLDHFAKFWENLSKNPSSSTITGIMDFLEYKELPITDDGHFLAYKGVSSDYWSINGNTETKVIKGEVRKNGSLNNKVGAELEVARNAVNDNREVHCSFGLHVGSLDYARGFGNRVVVVKVNPADVVSVPTDYNCQKCRVSAYKVVSEYECEITASVVDSTGNTTIVPDSLKERKIVINRISAYLDRKKKEGVRWVKIKSIQSIFSPNWISRQEVYDALQTLNKTWHPTFGVELS